MDQEQKLRIESTLKERGAILPCPRCGHNEFMLVDGYFNHPLQDNVITMRLGGPSVPSIAFACKRCGFLAQHALGAFDKDLYAPRRDERESKE